MRTLDGLKEAVEDPLMKQDSGFFHEVMGELVNRLGFFLTENWYDIVVPELGIPGIISTTDLRSVKRAAMNYVVANFALSQRYEKGEAYITVAAHHMNLCDLLGKRMRFRMITSDSKLGLENEVKQLADLPDEDPEGVIIPANTALEQGFVIQQNDAYLLSPEMIYGLVEKQESANEKSR